MFPHSQHLKLIWNLLILLPANKLKVSFNIWAGYYFWKSCGLMKKKWSGGPTFLYSSEQGCWKRMEAFFWNVRFIMQRSHKKGWGSDSDCQLFLTTKQDLLPTPHPRTPCNNQTIHTHFNQHFNTCGVFLSSSNISYLKADKCFLPYQVDIHLRENYYEYIFGRTDELNYQKCINWIKSVFHA